MYLGKDFPAKPGPGGHLGELIAWDPVKQEKVWGVKERTPFNGGTLTTAGGLVFAGKQCRRSSAPSTIAPARSCGR